MNLTTFSDHVLRVLTFVHSTSERIATIEEIAIAYGVSHDHLMKVRLAH